MPATLLQRLPAIPATKPPGPGKEIRTLIDDLISEQKQLQTPVARYSDYHDTEPDLAPRYRTLIPLSKPGKGRQYAFEVSLDRCTGCKACVSACHSLNGLDDGETWRDVGMIHGGRSTSGWQQTVTTACHHCEDPGCMNGCPVAAYEKDEDTGIVRHLDDQCIGCSYCILKCPYDVPKYSKKRGIVRKCDMCHQRLAEGEAPACVQACPTEAIRIVTVAVAKVETSAFLPMAPDPAITRPTTRYVGREVPAGAVAADRESLRPEPAHWPLVLMLVLTQAGIGLLAGDPGNPGITMIAAGLFFAGLGASFFHLGQPLKAWRFFLGLRTSWLSREILAFSMFAPVPILLAGLPHLPDFPLKTALALGASSLALPLGLAAVFTSVMVYHDTRRVSWRFPVTVFRFFGTVVVFAVLSWGHVMAFSIVVLLKLLPDLRAFHLRPADWSSARHSARLTRGPLRRCHNARLLTAIAAPAALPFSPWLAFLLLIASEVLERQLFFQAVHAPKMPGQPGTGIR